MATKWTELEKTSNKVTSFSSTTSDTKYPSEKLVKTNLDKCEKSSNKKSSWSSTPSDTNYPSEKLVKSTIDKLESDISEGNIVIAQATNASYASNAGSASSATNATNARNAIVNSNGGYSGFVNDTYDILKTGNCIISKKENLFMALDNSEMVTTKTITLSNELGEYALDITYGEKAGSSGAYNYRKTIRIPVGTKYIYDFFSFGSDASTMVIQKFEITWDHTFNTKTTTLTVIGTTCYYAVKNGTYTTQPAGFTNYIHSIDKIIE